MPRKDIYIIAAVFAALFVGNAYVASVRDAGERAQLKKDVAEAIAQNHKELDAKLSSIEADKKIKAPAAIVQRLPEYVPLPKPIYLSPPATVVSSVDGHLPDAPAVGAGIVPQGALVIPPESVDAFWQHETSCKEDSAKLATCQSDLEQETKLAKGPHHGFFGKLKSKAKTLFIDAAITGAVICGTGHCK